MGHLRENGFNVKLEDRSDSQLREIKAKYRVPESLFSCHTAVVENYVIEGHVPADLIYRVLKERPAVLGLAVPGMPIGAPGMEGRNPEPYNVFTFDRNGQSKVYARR